VKKFQRIILRRNFFGKNFTDFFCGTGRLFQRPAKRAAAGFSSFGMEKKIRGQNAFRLRIFLCKPKNVRPKL
jgi:hypothetical protein